MPIFYAYANQDVQQLLVKKQILFMCVRLKKITSKKEYIFYFRINIRQSFYK